MKTLYIVVLALIFSGSGCKKETETESTKPIPGVIIKFGYTSGFFEAYFNQNSIPLDSVRNSTYFAISIVETNLSSGHGFTTDSGVVEFDLLTKNDAEHFHNRQNTIQSVGAIYTSEIFGVSEFGCELAMPYKINPVAIKGNDTIEISDLGDFVKIDYKSKYTGLQGKDSIKITK